MSFHERNIEIRNQNRLKIYRSPENTPHTSFMYDPLYSTRNFRAEFNERVEGRRSLTPEEASNVDLEAKKIADVQEHLGKNNFSMAKKLEVGLLTLIFLKSGLGSPIEYQRINLSVINSASGNIK